MLVEKVTPASCEDVRLAPGEYYLDYRRWSADSWECRMGESWEEVYDDAELEAAYQAYKLTQEQRDLRKMVQKQRDLHEKGVK